MAEAQFMFVQTAMAQVLVDLGIDSSCVVNIVKQEEVFIER